MKDKYEWVTQLGGFFILIGFSIAGFILLYKFVDLILWLIKGYWFGYQFYDFLYWIGFSLDKDYITGWVGLDTLIVDHIILKSFAGGSMTISGLYCLIGGLCVFIGSKLDEK